MANIYEFFLTDGKIFKYEYEAKETEKTFKLKNGITEGAFLSTIRKSDMDMIKSRFDESLFFISVNPDDEIAKDKFKNYINNLIIPGIKNLIERKNDELEQWKEIVKEINEV